MNTLELSKNIHEYMIEMRRHFHENPELSGKEVNTLETIKAELTKMGIPFHHAPNGGIVAIVDSGKEGKTVLLRSDVDALPVSESETNAGGNKKVCISKNDGVMHACGHDGHTATLLGALKILGENKDAFSGKVIGAFEQGEEGGGNWVFLMKYMENHGIKFDTVFACHLQIGVDAGKLAFVRGNTMATIIRIAVKIKGRGGHGSRPDMSVSPVDCFVAIYNGMNTIRMRNCDPYNPLTFSIGHVQSGTKANIIPDELVFEGTVRLFDREQGLAFRQAFVDMVENTCKAYGCECEFLGLNYPGIGVYNDPQCVDMAFEAVKNYMGEGIAIEGQPWMASESFSSYQKLAPGVLCFAGIRNEEAGITADHHNPMFEIDEEGLKYSCGVYVAYALQYLNNSFDTDEKKWKGSLVDFLNSTGTYPERVKLVEEYKE